MNRWYSNPTQIGWACYWLILRQRGISHVDEIAEAKGWRLYAIIHILRHKYDWPIITKYIGKIAYYHLGREVDVEGLKKPPSFYFYLKKKGVAAPSSNPDN